MKKTLFVVITVLSLFFVLSCYLFTPPATTYDVVIEPSSTEVIVGQTGVFSVSGTENITEDIVYTSSNVAAVEIFGTNDSIVARGLSIGTAIITAKLGDTTLDSSIVNVVPADDSDLYITSTVSSLNMNIGETVSASASLNGGTIAQQSLLTWTTTNTTVISVTGSGSNIIIKALSSGTALVNISHVNSINTYTLYVIVGTESASADYCYLTTSQGVQEVSVNNNLMLNASLVGGTQIDQAGITWQSTDTTRLTILGSGNNVIAEGIAVGLVQVIVNHARSTYPGIIYVNVTADTGVENKYLSLPQTVLETYIGENKYLTAQLINGTPQEQEQIVWTVAEGPSNIQVVGTGQMVLIKGIASGTSRIIVSHPASANTCSVYVDIASSSSGSGVYITGPSGMISMNPTDVVTISASLVNGTINQQAQLSWQSLSAPTVQVIGSGPNVALKGLSPGLATVQITHPLATSPFYMYVNVLEGSSGTNTMYLTTNLSLVDVDINDNVLVSANIVGGTQADRAGIIWTSSNANIATVTGSGGTVIVNGISEGLALITINHPKVTTPLTIYADVHGAGGGSGGIEYYISSSSNIIDITPSSEMLVSAYLNGGTEPQQNQLVWTIQDPTVLSLMGTGKSVLITPLKEGVTQLTVSHPLCATNYIIYVRVAMGNMVITLSDDNITMKNGDTEEITASLEGTNNYSGIVWSIDTPPSATPIAQILGVGQTINVLAVAPGTTVLRATLPNGSTGQCNITITESNYFNFLQNSLLVHPGNTYTVNYEVLPTNATINWSLGQGGVITYVDNPVTHQLTITALDVENQTTITGMVGGLYDILYITNQWDYYLTLSTSTLNTAPTGTQTVTYAVSPPNSSVTASITDTSVATCSVNQATKVITITPKKEGHTYMTVTGAGQSQQVELTYQHPTISWSYLQTETSGTTWENENTYYVPGTKTMYVAERMTGYLTLSFNETGVVLDGIDWNNSGNTCGTKFTWNTVNDNQISMAFSGTGTVGQYSCGTMSLSMIHGGQTYTDTINVVGISHWTYGISFNVTTINKGPSSSDTITVTVSPPDAPWSVTSSNTGVAQIGTKTATTFVVNPALEGTALITANVPSTGQSASLNVTYAYQPADLTLGAVVSASAVPANPGGSTAWRLAHMYVNCTTNVFSFASGDMTVTFYVNNPCVANASIGTITEIDVDGNLEPPMSVFDLDITGAQAVMRYRQAWNGGIGIERTHGTITVPLIHNGMVVASKTFTVYECVEGYCLGDLW